AAIGGIIGGIGGFLSGSKAKKEEQARRDQAEADRLAQIAAQHRSMEIQLMEASGDAVGALAARRAEELAAMDPGNRSLAERIYALQDEQAAAEKVAEASRVAADAAKDLADQLAATVRTFADEVQAAAGRVDNARSALSAAYSREQSALTTTRDRFQSLADGLGNYLAGLRTSNGGAASYSAARSSLMGASNDNVQDAAETFLEAAKSSATDALGYRRDVALVQRTVAAAQAAALTEVSIADQQLSALEASVSGLGIVNMSVMSVREAIVALRSAMTEQSAAQTVVEQKPGYTNWSSYLTHYSDISAEWSKLSQDPALRQWWSSAEDFAAWHYKTSGINEGRTPYAAGGIFTNGIVSQPTSFHNSQMGEAGPEAIMPLVRGPEGLGVRMHGNDNDTASEVRALRQELAAALAAITANTGATADNTRSTDSTLLAVSRGRKAFVVKDEAA
ncbi:MAG: uncharacterized protein JWR59_253, partial [Brevundimonas sp.]|nr:uncharacterized protein [Brevundimonas sp.]